MFHIILPTNTQDCKLTSKLDLFWLSLLFTFNRSEYGAFWKCVQAGGIYMCTQLVKMLILATFFPDNILESNGDFFGVRLKVFTFPKSIKTFSNF